jgi:hypothetical protein
MKKKKGLINKEMLITSVHRNWPSLYINGFTLPEPHAIEIIMDFGF